MFVNKLICFAGVRNWALYRFVYHFLLIWKSIIVLMTVLSLLESFVEQTYLQKLDLQCIKLSFGWFSQILQHMRYTGHFFSAPTFEQKVNSIYTVLNQKTVWSEQCAEISILSTYWNVYCSHQVFFPFFAHQTSAKKNKIYWNVPLIEKKFKLTPNTWLPRSIPMQKQGSVCNCFFQVLAKAKPVYLHNWHVCKIWVRLN